MENEQKPKPPERPANNSHQENQNRLDLRQKIERSLAAAGRGEILTQKEVEERMAKWLDRPARA